MYTFQPNRDETINMIQILAKTYPACFSENPRQRRPLKKNIIADLIKDGAPIPHEHLPHVIRWYESHFGYQHQIKAGAKRIDLNGKEVQVITEPEQRAAESYIRTQKQREYERNQGLYKTLKVDPPKIVPSLPKPPLAVTLPKPPPAVATKQTPPTQLALIQSALDAVSRIMIEDYSPALRVTLTVAALGVVVAETQKLISQLQAMEEKAASKDDRKAA